MPAIVAVLASRVRLLTLDQVARTWYADARHPRRSAREALRRAESQGLVAVNTVMAHPEVVLAAPLYRWSAETLTTPPHFGRLAWQARKRFGQPPVRTIYVTATAKAKSLLDEAAHRRGMRATELTHDIHVAQIYLKLRREAPKLAASWVGEDRLAHTNSDTRPDALAGTLAIDFVGQYRADKLAVLFDEYRSRFAAFELW
jgi:hypothetical protein